MQQKHIRKNICISLLEWQFVSGTGDLKSLKNLLCISDNANSLHSMNIHPVICDNIVLLKMAKLIDLQGTLSILQLWVSSHVHFFTY